jgi:Ca2+-binding RTX toxin-like protein
MKTRQLSARRLFARFRTAAQPHRIELSPPRVRFVERLESRIALAYDAFITGGVVTFIGDGAEDTLAFTTAVEATSGKVVLMHNRFSAGDPDFASDTDLDSGMPGIQSMAVSELTQVNVNAGGGNDTVKLGDDRSPASALPPAFMLDGGGGINGFVINWKSDQTGRAAVVTDLDISGVSTAGGGAWHVANFARIDLFGGSGADTFDVMSTGSGTPVMLDGGNGADTYRVKFGALFSDLKIDDTGAGPAAGNQLIAIGTDGSDQFSISAGLIVFQDEDKRPPQVVVYFGDLGSLKFDGVLGNDTFTLFKLGVPANLFGGAGNDTFSILGNDAPVTIDGQAGGDTIDIQLGALRGAIELTDTGTPGADRLILNGTIGRDIFTVFATRIDWSGPGDEGPDESVTVAYGTGVYLPAQIVIDARAGNDTLNVMSTAAGTTLLVEGGDGIDSFGAELPLISGKVTLADHEFVLPGSAYDPDTIYAPDTLTVFGSDGDDEITVANGSIRDAAHALDFSGIDKVEILAGKGNDHVQISNSALLPAVREIHVSGGEGDDTLLDSSGTGHSLGAERAVIAIILEGDEGDDILTGGLFANTIGGGAGDDVIKGGGGDDAIDGGAGDDLLLGGAGHDMLTGGLGANTIGGAAGHDTVIESGDFDWIVTNTKVTGAGTDKLSGIERAQITGGDSANRIDASKFSGQFTAIGGAGDDLILGGSGNDFLTGGLGANTVGGAAGFDTVIEEADADFTLAGDSRSATLDGPGDDLLLSIARVMVTGGDSANVLDASAFHGSVAFFGGGGNDLLLGGFGNDILSGGLGSNTIGGAAGIDTLVEESDANFTLTDTSLNGPGFDVLDGIEVAMLTGGEGDNTIDANTWTGRVVLIGLGGDDHLTGGRGSDLLLGGDGDDVLIGGPGLDRLIGGPGKNTLTQ